MDELKCMLGDYKSKTAICYKAECKYCGYELHEAERRKRMIDVFGLSRCGGGLLGLVIRR